MNLNLSQIKEITMGAVRIEESRDGFHFYRFTAEQETLYKERSADFYKKAFSASGVKMRFRTNSQKLFLKTEVSSGSSRSYFAFDVFVDGKKIDTMDNFSVMTLVPDYTQVALPLGVFSKEFDLGVGEKEVSVYFPWTAKVVLKEATLDEGSFVEPVKPHKKMLCFGDSITQGYDALYPCEQYTSRLAHMLDAQEYNKAIGGEIFFPALAATKDAFEPDYITVAYGTNDWNRCTRDEFIHNCKGFLGNLRNNYPNAKIFVITPIWRKDMKLLRPFGDFACVGDVIEEQAAAFANISVVRGFAYVPQQEELFADLRLHPTGRGFEYYFENLWDDIKNLLDQDA